jgi:putative heme-binding domain-containing protein
LSAATVGELAALLEHPNGWHRETAQRLLYERQDPESVPALRRLVRESAVAVGRQHALYTLAGLKQLQDGDLWPALADEESQVRRHAVRLAEPRLAEPASAAILERICQMSQDESPVVRFQVAFTLGQREGERTAVALARIAARDSHDDWPRAAIFSSASRQPLAILANLLRSPGIGEREGMAIVIRELAYYATASLPLEDSRKVLDLAAELPEAAEHLHFALVAGLGLGLERHKKDFASIARDDGSTGARRLLRVREQARRIAIDSQAGTEERLAALELFRFTSSADAIGPLAECLAAREPPPLQMAAIRLLKLRADPQIARELAERWRHCSAAARHEIVEALLSRTAWSEILLAALEQDTIAAGQLAIPQRARLVNSTVPAIKERAVRLLGPGATSARGEVAREYQLALRLATDRARGEEIFRRECLTCHRFGTVGHEVGPNLQSIRHRSAEEILVHLFDPNRDVPPQFISHTVQLRDGRVLTGLIASESDGSLELQRAENARDTVFRRDVEAIISSGKSLMPEGIEQKLTRQDVADLLAFLLGESAP